MKDSKNKLWVGIDVGKQSISVAIDASNVENKTIPLAKLPTKDFKRSLEDTDSLIKWIEKYRASLTEKYKIKPEIRILMEHTGCYSRDLLKWLKEKYPESCPHQGQSSQKKLETCCRTLAGKRAF